MEDGAPQRRPFSVPQCWLSTSEGTGDSRLHRSLSKYLQHPLKELGVASPPLDPLRIFRWAGLLKLLDQSGLGLHPDLKSGLCNL